MAFSAGTPTPQSLNAIVLQALAKKPQDRFASVKEFASAFAAVLKPNTAQSPEVQKRPRQITPKRLPEYAPAAKKVSSRTTTPDTKWAPRKYSFLWLSYTLGKAVGLISTKWRPFLWTLLIGIVAGVIPIVEACYSGADLLPTVAILSLLTGLVARQLTRQRRTAWISGVTPVIMLTVYVSIYQFPFLTATWPVFLILAPICGLISFGSASLATRKHHK